MSKAVRFFDYVNHPYEQVREALHGDVQALFHEATQSAASRAQEMASELRVNIGGMEVGAQIAISITAVTDEPGTVTSPAVTRLQLEWEAARSARLFPFMKAELAAYRLTGKETQLDFSGTYDPPLGAVGEAVDAAIAHRLAEASVHRFVGDVAAHLRQRLDG